MPLVKVSAQNHERIKELKKRMGLPSADAVIAQGLSILEDQHDRDFLKPTQDWDLFKSFEDFDL